MIKRCNSNVAKDKEGDTPYKPKVIVEYDELAICVGGAPNTFQTPGVEQYWYRFILKNLTFKSSFFLRSLSNARDIRERIIECFERASNPSISEEEKRRLLHFVVIGGGPTSVEFTAELHGKFAYAFK
jgi:NADH:ubiquinone reductase (non-electrogenic)